MKVLVDADYVVYKCCAGAESEIDFGDDVIVVTSRFSEAYGMVRRELEKITLKFGAFGDSVFVSTIFVCVTTFDVASYS